MGKIIEKKGEVVPRVRSELTPFEQLDRVFDRLFEGGGMRPFDWRWPELGAFRTLEERLPHVDVIERDDHILVRAELPGIPKEKVSVTLAHDMLTIKAEVREETEEKGEYYRSEIRRGAFSRTISLPAPVKSEKAKAQFLDGILEITLPKEAQAARHTIKVE